jgi:succinate-acetate transporter protein
MSTDEELEENARNVARPFLAIPSSLLTVEGMFIHVGGIVIVSAEMVELQMNNIPPGIAEIALGILAMVWGGLVVRGAWHMHEVTSYKWAMIGSVLGLLPFMVGLFGIITLQNPKVLAGFAEAEGGKQEEE